MLLDARGSGTGCAGAAPGAVLLGEVAADPGAAEDRLLYRSTPAGVLVASESPIDVDGLGAGGRIAGVYASRLSANGTRWTMADVHDYGEPLRIPLGGYALRERGSSFPARVFRDIGSFEYLRRIVAGASAAGAGGRVAAHIGNHDWSDVGAGLRIIDLPTTRAPGQAPAQSDVDVRRRAIHSDIGFGVASSQQEQQDVQDEPFIITTGT